MNVFINIIYVMITEHVSYECQVSVTVTFMYNICQAGPHSERCTGN